VLDQFRVDASTQQQGGASVPEIVPADKLEILLLEQRLEVAVYDVLGVEGVPLRVAKTSSVSS
jgi:hypothetical protein